MLYVGDMTDELNELYFFSANLEGKLNWFWILDSNYTLLMWSGTSSKACIKRSCENRFESLPSDMIIFIFIKRIFLKRNEFKRLRVTPAGLRTAID